jgi:hypothetical protein
MFFFQVRISHVFYVLYPFVTYSLSLSYFLYSHAGRKNSSTLKQGFSAISTYTKYKIVWFLQWMDFMRDCEI